jgi:hypothetical protein
MNQSACQKGQTKNSQSFISNRPNQIKQLDLLGQCGLDRKGTQFGSFETGKRTTEFRNGCSCYTRNNNLTGRHDGGAFVAFVDRKKMASPLWQEQLSTKGGRRCSESREVIKNKFHMRRVSWNILSPNDDGSRSSCRARGVEMHVGLLGIRYAQAC